MLTLREAAQRALEALDCPGKAKTADEQAAITALKAALTEPAQEPLTIERLRDALVASRIIPPAAVEEPDEYDDGLTLFRIEALHRRLVEQTNTKSKAQVNRDCPKCSHPMWCAVKCDQCGRVFEDEVEPEPYTDDVTRIMREAGMTFHLGLPHKAVVEQMTRVVDLVYAEASIKAAQQFAAPPQRRPLTEEEIQTIWAKTFESGSSANTFARAIERAHEIGVQE